MWRVGVMLLAFSGAAAADEIATIYGRTTAGGSGGGDYTGANRNARDVAIEVPSMSGSGGGSGIYTPSIVNGGASCIRIDTRTGLMERWNVPASSPCWPEGH